MVADSRLPNFRALTPAQRLAAIADAAGLTPEERRQLAEPGALGLERADGMIENVIGAFELPLGVAGNFQVNGRDVLVPMAVEEPSVVAAASFMAKLARGNGGFETSSTRPLMRAQVQVLGLSDPHGARVALLRERERIVTLANSRDQVLIGLGGGCQDIEAHVFADTPRGPMLVLHLIVDVRDAMGANTVNTMAEAVAPLVEEITGGTVRLRILSNLADLRLSRARVRLTPQTLDTRERSGAEIIEGVLDAYVFAATDPYRAATHNKGIMNGVSAVVLATGNDTRAVEAGAHAYAARDGRYGSLTHYEVSKDGDLVGSIELPLAVGLIGGVTKIHPTAQACLKILGVTTAERLARVIAAVGLAQNFSALKALTTVGIQSGHMALHAQNVAIMAGAVGGEVDAVARALVERKAVRIDVAQEILETIRR